MSGSEEILFPSNQPLGAGLLPDASSRTCLKTYSGKRLAGAIRYFGGSQTAYRWPLAISVDQAPAVISQLVDGLSQVSTCDPCFLAIDGCHEKSGRDSPLTLLMLDDSQLPLLSTARYQATLRLPTGQILEALHTSLGEQALVQRYGDQHLEFSGLDRQSNEFQLARSSLYAGSKHSTNAYYCVLHPTHKEHFGSGLVLVRNHILEQDHPDWIFTFPVLVRYDPAVPPMRAGLDDSVATAVGLRPGELCQIEPVAAGTARFTKRLFSYRHTICRVLPATSTDQEQAIARLPHEVLDILGLVGGEQVVLEAGSDRTGSFRHLKVRALAFRSDAPTFRPGGLDVFDVVGSVDIAHIRIDRERRDALGIAEASAVYVRPALISLIAAELAAGSLLLGAGAIATLIADEVLAAVLMAIGFFILAIFRLMRKFR